MAASDHSANSPGHQPVPVRPESSEPWGRTWRWQVTSLEAPAGSRSSSPQSRRALFRFDSSSEAGREEPRQHGRHVQGHAGRAPVTWSVPGLHSPFCLLPLCSFNVSVKKWKFFWWFSLVHLVPVGLEPLSLISQPLSNRILRPPRPRRLEGQPAGNFRQTALK